MKSLVEFFLRRQVLTLMLYGIFLMISFLTLLKIDLELVPMIPSYSLELMVDWAGCSPETIEREIVSLIEKKAATIRGIGKISSESRRNSGVISMEILKEYDPTIVRFALQDSIKTLDFPSGSSISINTDRYGYSDDPLERLLNRFRRTSGGGEFTFRISGDEKELNRSLDSGNLKNFFLSLPSVSDIRIGGEAVSVVRIKLSIEKLVQYDIAGTEILDRLNELKLTKKELGSLQEDSISIPVYLMENRIDPDDMASIAFRTKNGSKVLLGEMADIFYENQFSDERARVNGKSAVIAVINKREEANLLQFSAQVKNKLEILQSEYNRKIDFEILTDDGKEMKTLLLDMGERLIISILVVFLVIFLFFRQLKPSLLVMLSLGVSLIMTLSALFFSGLSINLISVSALVLASGMLVDNTLVIFETIRNENSIKGIADQMGHILSVLGASSLTNIVVFMPFLFFSGSLKDFFLPFAVTVFWAMGISLFVSLSLTPGLFYRFMAGKESQKRGEKRNFFYPDVLMRFRKIIVPLTLAIVMAVIILLGPVVWKRDNYFSFNNNNEVSFSISMLSDARFEETESLVQEFERPALEMIKDNNVQLIVSVNRTRAFLRAIPQNDEGRALLASLQALWSQKMGNYVSVGFSISGPLGNEYSGSGFSGSYSSGSGIRIESYDYALLKKHAIAFSFHLRRIPYLYKIDNGFQREKRVLFGPSFPGYDLVIDMNAMVKSGLDIFDIKKALSAFDISPSEISSGGTSGKIKYKMTGEWVFFQADEILDIKIPGKNFVIGDICELRPLDSALSIIREDQKYIHHINYKVKGMFHQEARDQINSLLSAYEFPAGFNVYPEDFWAQQMYREKKSEMGFVFLISAFLVFMVLAGHFESLKKPFLVFLSLPLALFGILLVLYFFGKGMGLGAILGLIILSGLAVNDSILFIDTVNHLKGNFLLRSKNAVQLRFRPILITSLTTILALLPTIWIQDSGDEILNLWKEFSFVVVIGMISSTFFALYFIPVCYTFWESKRDNR